MSFLDRFKSQPRWKHADPAIRAAAVAELTAEPDHQRALLELAAGDEDANVRRTAIARVESVTELVRLGRGEQDEEARRELLGLLMNAATGAGVPEPDAALALGGIDDQKQLGVIAKVSPHASVRAAALARVDEVRTLSSVARKASDPQTACDAVGRITDTDELLAISIKAEHKDAAVAAFDRVSEGSHDGDFRQALEAISARTKHKSVAKRARNMIQSLDETEALQRAALEQWQQRLASVFARIEVLAGGPATDDGGARLAAIEAEWLEVAGTGTAGIDPATNGRFSALSAEAHAAVERYDLAQADLRAADEHRAAVRAAHIALCERVEAAAAESALDEIDRARAEWEGLAGLPDGMVHPELQGRFEAACRLAAERHADRENLSRTLAQLDALSLRADGLAASETLDEAAWKQVHAEWTALRPRAEGVDDAVTQRFEGAQTRVAQRVAERQAAEERVARQHAQRVEQLVERAHARVPAEDLTVREADRIVRDLRAALDAPPDVAAPDRQALLDRLKAALGVAAPRLHDLRELDEWKRFANAAVQEELIARTEALRSTYHFDVEAGPSPDDVEKAARELHDIQERWKQVAEAPRAQAQALWQRYRNAADPIQAKAREFFAARSEERKINLDRKLALIERAEALAESTDWVKTAGELKTLQQEWQQGGPVPRNDTRATWKRFREACDKFFTRRNADLADRKEAWAANLAKKEALCVRAEELAASRDWDRSAIELRRLQNEWKAIGPVRRTKSEAIWQRFRAAADLFFDRYKRRDEIEMEAKQADREALITELDALAQPMAEVATDAPVHDLADRVRNLRTRWNQTSSVVRHGADPLSTRFVDALEHVIAAHPDQFRGTELDVDASRDKMEKLVAKVEGFVADAPPAPTNSSQALADMLREALATNTIGGRAGDEGRWRAMGEDVRQAQAAWSRLGPVPGQAGRELTERFHRVCNRFFDQYKRRVPPAQQAPPRRKELQTR